MNGRISMVVAGLAIVLSTHVGVSAARPDTSAPSTNTASRSQVVIRCTRTSVADVSVARGRCMVSGAISDRGRFVERTLHGDFNRPNGNARTFIGANGSMWFRTNNVGYWRILKGSKKYAGIRGHGHETRRYVHGGPRVDITMRGTVSR